MLPSCGLPRWLLIGLLAALVVCAAGEAGGPPGVKSVAPADGAAAVSWTETLRVRFNCDVDPATVNATTFVVQNGEETVVGAVAYDAPSKTATFEPVGAFRPDTNYTAKITTGVADAGGIHLENDFSWSFRTVANTMQGLYTSGNRICTADGRPVVFHGLNTMDPAWMDHWNSGYFQAMADWHARLVRIPCHPAAFKSTGAEAYLRLLERGVALAAQRGMYSIIDFHGFGYPPTDEIRDSSVAEMMGFWETVATHFSGDTRIAFYDLFNEPVHPAGNSPQIWGDWRALAEKLIDEIRSRDPGRCVIVGGLSWSYDLCLVPADPVQRPNVVYAWHVYPGHMALGGVPNWDRTCGSTAQKYPVIVGEVGFDPNAAELYLRGTAEGFGVPFIDSYVEPRGIGWLAWCFSIDWAPPLLANWNYEPTVSGQFFRDRLLAH